MLCESLRLRKYQVNNILIERGYTGHEHLTTVGLIHMNGRIYDPVLRQFMSPDNFVQDPYNTQNFNRFAYVLNNPLLYTDPSGEEIVTAILIGVAVGVLTKAISNSMAGIPVWHGLGKAAVIGGVSGALSFGIGQATTGLDFATKASMQAGMHGMKGGIMASIDGGDFESGFAAGAVSSLVASGIDALGTNFSGQGAYRTITGEYSRNAFGNSGYFKAAIIASGGLSGGLSSSIAGGNFWDGVRQGLITSGLNHAMHSVAVNYSKNENFENLYETIESVDNDPPTYKYNNKIYVNKAKLYMAIFVDQAAEQFGIKDVFALAAALDHAFPSIDKPFTTSGASSKTSYASKYGEKLFPQKMPVRLPTHMRNGTLRYTKVLGRFLGRMAGPVGWAILTYDLSVTLYNTQIIYNQITN